MYKWTPQGMENSQHTRFFLSSRYSFYLICTVEDHCDGTLALYGEAEGPRLVQFGEEVVLRKGTAAA